MLFLYSEERQYTRSMKTTVSWGTDCRINVFLPVKCSTQDFRGRLINLMYFIYLKSTIYGHIHGYNLVTHYHSKINTLLIRPRSSLNFSRFGCQAGEGSDYMYSAI